jgi:hypothetical protein
MVCALPQVRAVRGLFLISGCELGIGRKPSAQGAAKPYVVETEYWDAAANNPLLVPSRDFEIASGSDGRGSSLRRARRIADAKLR